jgi:hypothetical protein
MVPFNCLFGGPFDSDHCDTVPYQTVEAGRLKLADIVQNPPMLPASISRIDIEPPDRGSCRVPQDLDREVLTQHVGSYLRPAARRCSSARNSWQLIPIALAIISAGLSLGPCTKPLAASRAIIVGTTDGTGGRGGFGSAFSIRAIRDLRLVCMAHCRRVAAQTWPSLQRAVLRPRRSGGLGDSAAPQPTSGVYRSHRGLDPVMALRMAAPSLPIAAAGVHEGCQRNSVYQFCAWRPSPQAVEAAGRSFSSAMLCG